MPERIRPYAWRRLDVAAGIAAGWLEEFGDAARVRVHELVADGPDCWVCRFEVELDESWHTRGVAVRIEEGSGIRELAASRDEEGSWRVNGSERPDLAGCLDVDVAATPLTNTLPIRRLNLKVGERTELRVVWINIPDLSVRATTQRYRRLESEGGYHRYEYSSLTGSRQFVLSVDEDGIVVDYEGFARRIRATR